MLDIKLTILKLLAEAAGIDQNQDNYFEELKNTLIHNQDNYHDYQLLCPILFWKGLILYFLNTDI